MRFTEHAQLCQQSRQPNRQYGRSGVTKCLCSPAPGKYGLCHWLQGCRRTVCLQAWPPRRISPAAAHSLACGMCSSDLGNCSSGQPGTSGKKAWYCSYSKPHAAIRSKNTVSQISRKGDPAQRPRLCQGAAVHCSVMLCSEMTIELSNLLCTEISVWLLQPAVWREAEVS